jgi:hypothetical protein
VAPAVSRPRAFGPWNVLPPGLGFPPPLQVTAGAQMSTVLCKRPHLTPAILFLTVAGQSSSDRIHAKGTTGECRGRDRGPNQGADLSQEMTTHSFL